MRVKFYRILALLRETDDPAERRFIEDVAYGSVKCRPDPDAVRKKLRWACR